MQKKKRTGLDATVKVVGRDQQDQILYLKKNPQTQIWNLERLENELHKEPPNPVLETVAKMVTEVWCGSPTELVSFLQIDMQPNTLTKHLNVNSGRLLLEHNIQYENTRTHAGRKITLTPVSEKASVAIVSVVTVILMVCKTPFAVRHDRHGKEGIGNEECANPI